MTALATDRASWLTRRKRGIGASEMAAILGISPFSTPLDVYMDKIGQGIETPDNDVLEFGRDMEPLIAKRYMRATGRTIAGYQVEASSTSVPCMIATLDAVCEDGRVVEFKTSSASRESGYGPEGTDEIPNHVLCQAHHQMIVTDTDEADVAAMLTGFKPEFRLYLIVRDATLSDLIIATAREFWDRVERRDPPPFAAPSDLRFVPALFGDGEGEIALPCSLADAWTEYQLLGEQSRLIGARRDAIKMEALATLGTASRGLFPDGSVLERKIIHIKEHAVKAGSQVRLYHKKGKGV